MIIYIEKYIDKIVNLYLFKTILLDDINHNNIIATRIKSLVI